MEIRPTLFGSVRLTISSRRHLDIAICSECNVRLCTAWKSHQSVGTLSRKATMQVRPARIFGYSKPYVGFFLLRPVGFEKKAISVRHGEIPWARLFFFETEVRFFLRNWSSVFPSKLKFGSSFETEVRFIKYSKPVALFPKTLQFPKIKLQFEFIVYFITVMPNLLFEC